MAFLARFAVALVVVFATYNPEGASYYHWVREGGGAIPGKAFTGIALLIAWIFLLKATQSSLGSLGVLLAAAFFGTLLWLILSFIQVSPQGTRTLTYLVEFGVAGVLSVGLIWSRFRQKVTGQVDVD